MKSIQLLPKFFVTLLICTGITFSCDNDDNISNPQEQNQDPDPTAFAENYFGNSIFRNFLGKVVDTNDNPIENVLVKVGNLTAMTDSNGVFIIENAPVNEGFGYVTAEKAGFIHASRAVVPSEGTNKVRIMMLPETIVVTTTSGTQETISLPNGSKVALEGDYIKSDGSSYSGSVNVIMHHLDPADDNMQYQMPGMLYAANAQKEERMLQTFGMLAVELKGDSGENLNLAEGSTAEITMPLDASLIGIAPSTIPLWHFDEVNGYWIEDGQATFTGNTYVGTVSHFSFWVCGVPVNHSNLCINFSDEDGNAPSNLWVTLSSINYGTIGNYTNENGEICGKIPVNETLELNLYYCDINGTSPIGTQTIGPFSGDSNLNITIPNSTEFISETVTGDFKTCNGNFVSLGYVSLDYAYQNYIDLVSDGNFEITILRCATNDSFRIKGHDFNNLQSTDFLYYTFNTSTTYLGVLNSCNSINQFIQFTFDDSENFLILSDPDVFLNASSQSYDYQPTLTIGAGNSDGTTISLFGILNPEPYIDSYNYSSYYSVEPGFYTHSYINSQYYSNFENQYYHLNYTGEVGEYIDMSFGFDCTDNQGNPHNVKGTLHVLRDY
ncbi:carboxypeptidase-like regulatory domain-containing protein [Psychroserpens mesophilus]|uniref:carboxypeptidase-like regulatory domain-containing protein n=1 Tax=Psychroserpens mesophilus TaxID=325473 RepID=UPI003F4958F8